jgi:hypothetical protein
MLLDGRSAWSTPLQTAHDMNGGPQLRQDFCAPSGVAALCHERRKGFVAGL